MPGFAGICRDLPRFAERVPPSCSSLTPPRKGERVRAAVCVWAERATPQRLLPALLTSTVFLPPPCARPPPSPPPSQSSTPSRQSSPPEPRGGEGSVPSLQSRPPPAPRHSLASRALRLSARKGVYRPFDDRVCLAASERYPPPVRSAAVLGWSDAWTQRE